MRARLWAKVEGRTRIKEHNVSVRTKEGLKGNSKKTVVTFNDSERSEEGRDSARHTMLRTKSEVLQNFNSLENQLDEPSAGPR